MIEKIVKDVKGLRKGQDKAMFAKQNIPYLAFFYQRKKRAFIKVQVNTQNYLQILLKS